MSTTRSKHAASESPADPGKVSSDWETRGAKLAEEMARAWRRGEPLSAEVLFQRQPEIMTHPQVAVRLVYEEFCLRREAGQPVDARELLARYPQWHSELAVVLECDRLIGEPEPPAFPKANETFEEFQLLHPLGSGAAGRVFLATQPALSDRPVVVKLTPRTGQEHLRQARLQHTCIVPLYYARDDEARNLRILCMPYFGGATLRRLLEELRRLPPDERSGRSLSRLLRQARHDATTATEAAPGLKFLEQASYEEAICWFAALLAEALHYAHQRGLLHLDVKPDNILLAADGQPMLLDFHLAREPIRPGDPPPHWLGGTPGYLSPEQQQAMAALRQGHASPIGVDGRSDVYSLGLVLREALACCGEASPSAALPRLNPRVTPGLHDIVHKCLAEDPADRYPDAGAVAADLRRHLLDLPLRGVANRSPLERWRKWRRRHVQWRFSAALVVTLGVAVAAVSLAWRSSYRRAEAALAAGDRQMDRQLWSEAASSFESGLQSVPWSPFQTELERSLRARRDGARRATLVADLHEIATRLRLLDGLGTCPPSKLRALAGSCHALWRARGELLADEPHPRAEESSVRRDLLDLLVFSADVRVELAPPEGKPAARQHALRLLDDAEVALGNSLSLELARRRHTAEGETPAPASQASTSISPNSAWDHYTLGRFHLDASELERAAGHLRRATDLSPELLWPHYYLAVCEYRRRHYEASLVAARICVALAPGRAECFYQRAAALSALDRHQAALEDLDRALELDPGLAPAWLHRGIALSKVDRFDEACASFSRALAHDAHPAEVNYQWALVLLEEKQPAAAMRKLRDVLSFSPEHAAARSLVGRLSAAP